MKKIIAAFDGLKYSRSTQEHAIHLARQTHAHLVGVFLEDPTYTSYRLYDVIPQVGDFDDLLEKKDAADKALRKNSSKEFETACQHAGLEFTVHHDKNIAIQGLKHESIYADLLLIDGRETLSHYTEKLPTRFIRDLLGDAQCPVLIVPPRYKPVDKIVLLYDGEPSSVHAIKMFSYLLPQLKHLPAEVISVNPASTTLHLRDNKLMKEFMKRHYPHAKYTVLKGIAEEEIVLHLKQSAEQSLVVLGAYRRGAVSRWFRESMADYLMRQVKLPLFIAHNK
ncbi:MAG: universal stress protein [Chitinophagaceae bacterium]|nr:universal stress protein [Chitinophagaceae bacterium]